MEDYPVSQLRIVKVTFCHKVEEGWYAPDQDTATYSCHVSQLDKLVRSLVRLHYGEGNPHTGRRLDNLWKIEVHKVNLETKSYWWTTEDLMNNDDPKGAQIHMENPDCCETVWQRDRCG